MILKQRHSKKKILIIASLLAVSVLACSYYFYSVNNKNKSINQTQNNQQVDKVNYDPPTSEQVDNGTAIKKDSVDKSSGKSKTESPAVSSEITITVAQKSNDGKYLQIRSYVNIVDTTAKCTLSLTNNSKTISRNVDVQTSASISSCKGFDISIDELSTGTWQMEIKYEGDLVNRAATRSIEI